ncbi:MAG: hypothetical protein K8F52_12730 [Candidatus Scalindua rubra]|uniref:Tetratricopeptide repeat protein n=1 Tax=Candidatus Scalindua brodae TaxID=237368 RepID=A0A0B0EM32_9BACT|nr:MAG: hypothetical protein SCABRO_00530 [Candidatus Scalindua brodae]MBZ0109524.1 hypothetical protein [Candidatus Scalindua rubra]TWU33470.1 hypothetical protein S225a_13570 [Candidatus Brocadiaceae bacterium S225]
MSLKIFIAILFLFSFVFTSVSHADEPMLRKTEDGEEAVKILSGGCTEKNSTKKAASPKDKHLNGDLAMLEKCMERKLDNKAFGDICKRYIGLTRQYGEAGRAINFFNGLAKRHPQSPNAHAVSGAKTYGQGEIETGFNQRLNLINSRLNLICSQHGHDSTPTGYKGPVKNQRL